MPKNMRYHSKWLLYESLRARYGSDVSKMTKITYKYVTFESFVSVFKESKLWIMKPLSMNRGRGITVLRCPQDAREHQKIYAQKEFIVQHYLSDTLLYQGRKLDLRCYALVIHGGAGYLYSEGYFRTSSAEYDVADTALAAHLTNNEFQKNEPGYATHEDGNMLSFEQFDSYTKGQFL